MLSLNNAYYSLKQYVPLHVRIALRRWRAMSRRRTYSDVWPIDEKAGAKPPGWPGWPESKRFAVVLTHDVEGRKGLARVERVMSLERKLGFRSSFNFVPEGEYAVPETLRQTLDRAGFEVGIHGLEHDGKLYASQKGFARKAAAIREYVRKWNVAGFRSPFMQHRLAWLHELGVEYDASTFDTDPFEPEPDGVRTVFPFWVPGPKGRGFVELPYSLVQDFTLFVILREPNIEIWKQKLDWIAERGGMVLLTTHPDYMCFDSTEKAWDEYPVSHYEELLDYVRGRYNDVYWSALPRDVARFYRDRVPLSSRNSRKKICMLTYSNYESDGRVRRYAETLAKRGDLVDVIALAGTNVLPKVEEISGVTTYRVQRRERNERHMWAYVWRLLRFHLASSALLTRRHHRLRYDLIHVHNVPDCLVFAAWYPKWTGAKVILDIHDIVPELYANKFGTKPDSFSVGLLKKVEKQSAAFVDHVIVSNDLWRPKLISRSVAEDRCSVFLNHVDPAIFYPRLRTRTDGRVIILFPGTFQWHQGLDIAIEAFARIKDAIPNAEFHIYGGGSMKADLVHMANQLGLNGRVRFFDNLSLERIADVIANADLGVVPKRADSFGNEAYSTKIMEFMSQGVPVVASRTKIDTFYFDDKSVRFFASGDSQAMADAMLDVIQDGKVREALVAGGYEYVHRHNWEVRKSNYLELVDSLTTETFGRFEMENSSCPPPA